jgi:DNA-binding MarR family transcriptional regulator
MTGAEMMSATAMDKVRVSRGIAKLLNSGLITREADPKDRRRAILTPTTAGREIFQQIVPMIQDAEAAMMAALNAPERDALNDALAKIEDYLERT